MKKRIGEFLVNEKSNRVKAGSLVLVVRGEGMRSNRIKVNVSPKYFDRITGKFSEPMKLKLKDLIEEKVNI